MVNKIFYSAYTCNNNVGDLLITKMQIEEYAKYGIVYIDATNMPSNFKAVLLENTNGNIKDFTKEFGLSYRGIKMFHVIRLLKKERFTHFTKSPGPYSILKMPISLLCKRLLGAIGYWYAKQNDLKVIAVGIDLNFSYVKDWLKQLNIKYFKIYDKIYVRSLPNFRIYSKVLHNVAYIPDMAFLYKDHVKYPSINLRKRIAFSFRDVKDFSKLKIILGKIISFFKQKDYEIDIIYQVESDKFFSQELVNSFKEASLNSKCLWYEDLPIYSKYEMVFSNRLHVLLIGAMYGNLPIALIEHNRKEQKISDIYKTVFENKIFYYINEEDLNIENIWNNRNLLYDMVLKSIIEQNNLCKSIIREIFNK